MRDVREIMEELYGTSLTVDQQVLIGELILSASRRAEAVGPMSDAERAKIYRARRKDDASVTKRHERHDSVTEPTTKETPHTPQENILYITNQTKAKKGSRLPETWEPSQESQDYGRKQGFSAAEIASMAEDFRLFFLSSSQPSAVKRDWEMAFKGWMRRDRGKKPQTGYKSTQTGKVLHGSFRNEFKPEPEGPKVSDEERQANLAKLATIKFGAKKL